MDVKIGYLSGKLGESQARALVANLERLLTKTHVEAAPVEPDDSLPYCESVFATALEIALLNGEVDAVVTSLHEVGVLLSEGLKLAAVTQRIDIREAAVTSNGLPLRAMPEGTQVVVDGPRRAHQVPLLRPDLEPVIVNIRPERLLSSIENDDDQAGLLAMSDLCWLHLDDRAAEILSIEEVLPGAGQGALGIVIREIDTLVEKAVLAVNHKPTWKCVQAERTLIAELGWNSCAPVGVHAELTDEKLHLRASAFGVKGVEIACAESSGPADDVEKLAKSVAEDLIRAGGDRIIREARLKAY